MNNTDEWIRADQIAELLYDCGKDYSAGKAQMWLGLQAGRIRAKALDGKLWKSGKGYRAPPPPKVLTDAPIDQEIWQATVSNADLSLSLGSYSASSYGNLFSRVELTGLAFNRAELVAYLGLTEKAAGKPNGRESEPKLEKGKAGRPQNVDAWNNAIAALIAYANEVGIDVADAPGVTLNKAMGFAASKGLEGDPIGIDRCGPGIRRAMQLIAGQSE